MGGRKGKAARKNSALHDLQLSFIGAGAMGEAMIGGLLSRHQLEPECITASARSHERLEEIHRRFRIQTTSDNRKAAAIGQVVVLAVKPQVLPRVFSEIQEKINEDALVVSIVAGTTIESIATGLKQRAIVRTMPNTPAQVGEGMTVWTATQDVSDVQRDQAQSVVAALGQELYVDDEKYLDVATAISGSGPSYVFLMMESMIDAAVHLGLSRVDARKLVLQTIRGSAIFAERSTEHPAEMRNAVTSPGGTTAEALYQLEKGSFRTVMSRAVLAAYQRSVQLGRINAESLQKKTSSK